MQIKIENQKLAGIINFLYPLPVKGQKSRKRTRFINLLGKYLKEFLKDEKDMLKEECNLDENGEPKIFVENGKENYDAKDKKHFIAERNKLYKEERVIDGGDNQVMLQTVKKILFDYDEELKGENAVAYDYICTQFEKAEEKSPLEQTETK